MSMPGSYVVQKPRDPKIDAEIDGAIRRIAELERLTPTQTLELVRFVDRYKVVSAS